MGKGAQGGNQQGKDSSADLLWVIGFFFVASFLLWYYGHDSIVRVVFAVRKKEILAISYVYVAIDYIAKSLHVSAVGFPAKLFDWLRYMEVTPLSQVDKDLLFLSNDVGQQIAYFNVALVVLLTAFLFSSKSSSRFRKVYSMETLWQQEKHNWPAIAPVARGLVKQDVRKGEWRMAADAVVFAKNNDLVKDIRLQDGAPGLEVIESKACAVFSAQLGPLWHGLESLPPHVQALFSVFAAKSQGNDKNARMLLSQFSKSAAKGKLDFSGSRELLQKYVQERVIGMAVSPHAYVITVMASMLELARTDGVLASADFIWLKTYDRRLWYMLNSMGRQVAVPEIAGAFAHFKVEKRLLRPLKVPMIGEAVKALQVGINDIKYNPDKFS